MAEREKILILGGTKEAAELAAELTAAGHDVTTSLAGRTSEPAPVAVKVRIGWFGGSGLQRCDFDQGGNCQGFGAGGMNGVAVDGFGQIWACSGSTVYKSLFAVGLLLFLITLVLNLISNRIVANRGQ